MADAAPASTDAAPAGLLKRLFRAQGRRGGYSPLVVVLGILLVVLVVPPMIYLITTSFYLTDFRGAFTKLTVNHYGDMLKNPRVLTNLQNTAIYAVGSACVAIVIGTVLAWIVERTNTPLRKSMIVVSIISLGTPNILYTIAWLLMLGKSGPVNDVLKFLLHTDQVVFNVYTMTGMVLIEGFVWTPLAFLLLASVMRSADASLEEASMMSGGGLLQTFRHITLKLSMPGIVALMLLIFIRSFESFEVPAVVGMPGRVPVMTTDIYAAVSLTVPPRYGQAAAFSILLLFVVITLIQFYNRLSRYAERYQTITGKGFRPRIIPLGKWRYVTCAVLIFMIFALIVMPVGLVVWASFMPFYDGVHAEALARATVRNYNRVFNSQSFRDSIGNTLLIGSGVATAVVTVAAFCGWLVVRRYRGAWLLDQLATMPLVFPAIVLGVAFLQIFLNTPFGLYGTLGAIIIASLVQYMPYGMRYSYAGALQIHSELEEASVISGAGETTTFRKIVVPLLMPALITSWLLIFLLSVRAVSLPIMLAGPNTQVVAVTLFDLYSNGQVTELAAFGVAWMSLMTVVSLGFYMVSRRYGMSIR
jgi:iron(III) transport system permease protein